MNRADDARFVKLQWMLLYLGGLMLVLGMFFRMEYTWDIRLHTLGRLYFRCAGRANLFRDVLGKLAPSLGGNVDCGDLHAFSHRTHLDPAAVSRRTKTGAGVPARTPVHSAEVSAAADCSRRSRWTVAPENTNLEIMAAVARGGPAVYRVLVAVQWPFASFLMTNAARNSFFGAAYLDFSIRRNRMMRCANFSGPNMGLFFGAASRWPCSLRRSAPGLVLR